MNDVIMNGVASSGIASLLLDNNFDVGALRPYKGDDGQSYVSVRNTHGEHVVKRLLQNDATLRKNEWQLLDKAIREIAIQRRQAWADLSTAGLMVDIPNAMGKTVYQSQASSDMTDAIVSMDGINRSESDRPVYSITNIPLPIVHKDFSYTLRELETSRQNGQGLDLTSPKTATRKVLEIIEKLTCGTLTGTTYGGGTIYGYLNYPGRITATVTAPTTGGWTPSTAYNEVLNMIEAARLKKMYGPFMLYFSGAWEQYMFQDFKANGDSSLLKRLKEITKLTDVRGLDFLGGAAVFRLILVQMTEDTVRGLNGMDVRAFQWPSNGGWSQEFKVAAINVPQIRSDYDGNCGLVVGS